MKSWIKIFVGSLAMIFVIAGMNYAYKSQTNRKMDEPEIIIHIEKNSLITRNEIRDVLISERLFYPEIKFKDLNIKAIEKRINEIPEILNTTVFTNIGSHWKIEIKQREPIVKVINQYGEKYYIDSKGVVINASIEHTARVLVANGQIKERPENLNVINIINNDSLKTIYKIDDIYRISNYVCSIPFLEAQISQIFVRDDGELILIPQIGDQIIVFGTVTSQKEIRERFDKLIKFYEEGIKYEGWSKYKEINLKYSGQVVCKKR